MTNILVSCTKQENMISALSDLCHTYGNREKHISDNDLPFNSKLMEKFANQNNNMHLYIFH